MPIFNFIMEVLKPYRDENNHNILTVLVPATIMKLPKGDSYMTNSNGTEYSLATCHVKYPNGTEEKVQSVIWRSSLEQGIFSEGDEIVLRTQLEGEYAGNSVVEYRESVFIDSTALGIKLDEAEEGNDNKSSLENIRNKTKEETSSNKQTYFGCAIMLIVFVVIGITARPLLNFFGDFSIPLLLIATFWIGSLLFNQN